MNILKSLRFDISAIFYIRTRTGFLRNFKRRKREKGFLIFDPAGDGKVPAGAAESPGEGPQFSALPALSACGADQLYWSL